MLDTKRISEAETNVKRYFEEGLLIKTQNDQQTIQAYIRNSEESSKAAEIMLSKNPNHSRAVGLYVMDFYS